MFESEWIFWFATNSGCRVVRERHPEHEAGGVVERSPLLVLHGADDIEVPVAVGHDPARLLVHYRVLDLDVVDVEMVDVHLADLAGLRAEHLQYLALDCRFPKQ